MNDLLVTIPIYNEENNIEKAYNSIRNISKDCKILFVNDGSIDKSQNIISNLEINDKNLHHVLFSRNFGKESAILCGLNMSVKLNVKYTCVMDCDGQDPFYLLTDMYDRLKSNKFDAVACRRVNRKGESIIRSFFSRMFYKIINKFSNTNIPEGARDYIMMNNTFRDTLLMYKEKCRFFKWLYNSVGYNIDWIEYENIHIDGRKSKWSFMSLFRYAFEGITSSSNVLLNIVTYTGVLSCLISFLLILVIIIRRLVFGDPVQGWASTICIIIFGFGIMYIFMGIIGLYLSKNFIETKNRPMYLIKDSNVK